MNDVNNLYRLWLNKTASDAVLHGELEAIADKPDEILDRFYKDLEFGTAGLRGILGAGTNRMNVFTVNHATQGLSDYLNSVFSEPSVAVAYDSRINSSLFAKSAASVFAANGIRVYIFPELVPTPMLSFAVRRLSCSSGIVITASHNPSKYNGYKCYDSAGYQMTDEAAATTYDFIQKTDIFYGVETADFDAAVADGRISFIEPWLYEEYYRLVRTKSVCPEIYEKVHLGVVYSPLNGTGNKPVREILRRSGLEDVTVVPEQELPDGNFPTCPFPNPEIHQVFERAMKIAEESDADLLLATDPDCDRVGIAVRDAGEYKLLSGNDVSALLSEYLLTVREEKGTLPNRPLLIKSFVTTDLVEAIAKEHGAQVENLLTGFKYIGESITRLERTGEADRFILGMEESYGYLSGVHARDKDGVVAAMLICEMAAYYKAKGRTLFEALAFLFEKHGVYYPSLFNFAFEGAAGMEKMSEIMDTLRDDAPKIIGGVEVVSVSDYLSGKSIDLRTKIERELKLPSSNVLAYGLPGGSSVIVRPSGTEPKIKLYVTAVAKRKGDAKKLAEDIAADMQQLMGVN